MPNEKKESAVAFLKAALVYYKNLGVSVVRVMTGNNSCYRYGTSFLATYARLPGIVDRILKGAKPTETAFEWASRRELVINLKTARELGLAVPPELLQRADRVIS